MSSAKYFYKYYINFFQEFFFSFSFPPKWKRIKLRHCAWRNWAWYPIFPHCPNRFLHGYDKTVTRTHTLSFSLSLSLSLSLIDTHVHMHVYTSTFCIKPKSKRNPFDCVLSGHFGNMCEIDFPRNQTRKLDPSLKKISCGSYLCEMVIRKNTLCSSKFHFRSCR